MSTFTSPLLECYSDTLTDIHNVHTVKSPHARTIDSSLQPLAWIITSTLYLPEDRHYFYNLLEKVQTSSDPNATEEWGLNIDGYIISKNKVTITSDISKPNEKLLEVSIPVFLQALHEWEEYLQENFPKFTHLVEQAVVVGRGLHLQLAADPETRRFSNLTEPDANGVYSGYVEFLDETTGKWTEPKFSTFFPKDWTRERLSDERDAAFGKRVMNGPSARWHGTSPSGVTIEGYLSPKGMLSGTFYPLYSPSPTS